MDDGDIAVIGQVAASTRTDERRRVLLEQMDVIAESDARIATSSYANARLQAQLEQARGAVQSPDS
ncbi:MAG: hypothetical protein AVDCRST_MAG71-2903 [uncultured Lysobacter sp.]|uniref:Uncharacterized protein n=1 Tax=uncultured Lysobacter sp. TaxID=271060 RepID=A0A6J4MFG1_9GAMM|nr:MAG: hypothetical protein AVDCRST_MAG71-2903 [uncultured Lysobacter sp.]